MKMKASFLIWLLAACSTSVIAGPLPHLRHRFSSLHYLNTSLTSSSTVFDDLSENASSTFKSIGISATQDVEVDTAVVVEPIGHTVFTRTEAAITFVNPDGDPVVTQPEETLLSTSYITEPSSTETRTPRATLVPSSTTVLETSASKSGLHSSLQPNLPSGRLSGDTKDSSATGNLPMFTYAPGDDTTETAPPSMSTITVSSFTTITQGSISTAAQMTPSSCTKKPEPEPIPTISQNSVAPSSNSKIPSTTSARAEASSSPRRTIFVTSTEYTTLYPSSAASTQTRSEPSPDPAFSAIASEAPIPTLTRPSAQTSTNTVRNETPTSSEPGPLPTSSLSPPPVIVITPTAGEASKSGAYSTSEAAPSSEVAPSDASTAAQPTSAAGSNSNGGGFFYPTQRPAAGSDSPASASSAEPTLPVSVSTPEATSTLPPPAPSESTPASSSSAESAISPSATSSGPLVVVPIDSSQIFTVTETVTTTATEKETVTVTATVTS